LAEECLNGLRLEGLAATRAQGYAPAGACIIEDPVILEALTVRQVSVSFPARPLLSCRFAAVLTGWIKGVVAPVAVGMLSSPLKSLHTGPGYVCRNRDNAADGKLSAHALGNAIDIVGFVLGDGRRIVVESPGPTDAERAFLVAVRTAGCGYFTTVLGPGSDAAHSNHLHVDILQHGRSLNYRICE
jgi:hypothetical protein